MKKTLTVILALIMMFFVSSCQEKIDFDVDFIVDDQIYDTVGTSGKETIKIPNNPTKKGYVFDGWYWDNGVWEKPFTANSLLDTPLSSNMRVYAKWLCMHSPSDWILDKYETCTETGSKHIECTICGESIETEVISALGHDLENYASKESTCTEVGWDSYEACKRENCTYSTKTEIETKPHSYVSETFEPTCTDKGYTVYSCACGEVYKDEFVDELGHDEIVDDAVLPTCEQSGLTEGKHCSVCNTVIVKQDFIDMLGHEYVDHDDKAATCTESGWSNRKSCTRCNCVAYVEAPALGHAPLGAVTENNVEPTCTVSGHYELVIYCDRCDIELSRKEETVESLGHDCVDVEA